MSEHLIHSTGNVSIDQNGDVWQYVPPNFVKLTTGGSKVTYGPAQTLTPGEPLAPGIWRVVNAGLEASATSTGVEVEPVTIT